jgi:serine/threonine-protein kinase
MTGAGYLVAALVLFPAPLLPNERPVPRLLGLDEDVARRELERAELAAAEIAREPHPTAAPGAVIWQDPPAGVAVPRGGAVHLVVGAGPPRLRVPHVAGLDVGLASRLLAAAGLRVDFVDSVEIADVPRGISVGTTPAAGDSVPRGTGLVLRVAR